MNVTAMKPVFGELPPLGPHCLTGDLGEHSAEEWQDAVRVRGENKAQNAMAFEEAELALDNRARIWRRYYQC